MKLSEAMRKGIAVTLPGEHVYIDDTDEGLRADALGAALIGAHGVESAKRTARTWFCAVRLVEAFPALGERASKNVPGGTFGNLCDLSVGIVAANDTTRMTREQIADRLAAAGL
ncbi:MAG: hypothetical protein ABIT01_21095 [Thermoanaerobaculia bacterium]